VKLFEEGEDIAGCTAGPAFEELFGLLDGKAVVMTAKGTLGEMRAFHRQASFASDDIEDRKMVFYSLKIVPQGDILRSIEMVKTDLSRLSPFCHRDRQNIV
jgi:hypothetical protein